MHMAAIALYSSSPPAAVWSAHGSLSSSSGVSFDADIHSRHGYHHSAVPRSVVGGLSGLFASNRSTAQCSGGADTLDCGPGMVRSASGDSLGHLVGSWDCHDSRSGSLSVSNGYLHRHKDRSPVSVLHGPISRSNHSSAGVGHSAIGRDSPVSSSALLPLDPHLDRRRTGMFPPNPVARSVGFEVDPDQSTVDSHLRRSGSDSIAVRNFNFSGAQVANLSRHSIALDGDLARPLAYVAASTGIEVEEYVLREARERFARIARESAETSQDFGTSRSPKSAEQLLADAQERHSVFFDDTVINAFFVAEEAHRGQLRRSGDLYLTHCVETAILLANSGADSTVVAAGLLHDSLDDGSFNRAQLCSSMGDEIGALVAGVSKLSACSQLARDNATAFNPEEADRLRTMFLAMVDVRVVLIKLADRLHNLRTLEVLPAAKQLRVAQETMEIFVPIANRLGIWTWKAEMEDICFRHLKPREYYELASKMSVGWKDGVMSSLLELETALHEGGIQFTDICGRPKNLYSIFSKMNRKGRSIDEIFDLRGLRLIVKDVEDCYAALETVHKLWAHNPKGLKNYIASPKANGYQSLHTIVLHKDGQPMEVQIRTVDMHHQAEYGMAAHWRYKESDSKYSSFVQQKVEWARWVLAWHSEIMDAKLRVSSQKGNVQASCPFPVHNQSCRYANVCSLPPHSEDDPLFIIMLKNQNMIVQELVPGSTTADVLFKSSGNTFSTVSTRRAKVNNEFVENFQQKLQMGDLVEITMEPESTPVTLSSSKCGQAVAQNSTKQNCGEIALEFQREQLKRMYLDRACSEEAKRGLPNSQGNNAGIASLS